MVNARVDDDALITTFGRLVEVHSRVGQQLGRSLEQQCGISHSMFEVLLRISRADGGQVSMSALAEQVALTTGGITRLLDRMVDAGLVERVPCPTDRRVYFAALTAAGRAKLTEASRIHAANLRQVFGGFTPREMQALDEMLDRLRGMSVGAARIVRAVDRTVAPMPHRLDRNPDAPPVSDESAGEVAVVAERLVLRQPAAAQRRSRQYLRRAVSATDDNRALHEKRTVA